MAEEATPEAAAIAAFLAKQLTAGLKKERVAKQHTIAEAISEIEHETQTKGSSFIKIQFIDPEWDLIDSGLFDRNSEGLLPELTIEFPQHSGWEWVLCACEPSNELSGPNFVCTFEDAIVRKLKNKFGAKRSKPGFNTRAEFIKSLCVEAGVKYRIPSVEGAQEKLDKELSAVGEVLREVEGIAGRKVRQEAEEGVTLTPEGEAVVKATALKEPGISAGSGVTVGGIAATPQQIAQANTLMQVVVLKKASQIAAEALIFAAIAESKLGNDAGSFTPNSAGYYGVLQGSTKTWPDPHDTTGMATSFLEGGKGFQGGGALALSRTTNNPVEIAVRVEVPSIWPDNAYAKEAGYSSFLPEAKAIIAAYGGVKAAGGGGSPATSKQGEVARGTSSNPSENSWDCIQRLAGAVQFYAFTDGRTFFYMDGPELAAQKVSAFVYPKPSENKIITENQQGHKVTETDVIQVPLSATFDNTSVEYFEDHKIKGKVQKRSRVGKPQSPSEIRINIVCGPKAFAAGEVFEYRKSGPLSGRWIVVDATRNWFKDRFTQFLCEPPTAPIFENEEGEPNETVVQVNQLTGELVAEPGLSNVPKAASGQYRLPPTKGPKGIGSFQGFQVALWIIPELEYAQQHGWKGRITSGYRPGVDPNTTTGVSEHSGTQYPHGAVDFGGPTEYTNREEFFAAAKDYKGLPLIPAQFTNYQGNPSDGGHASGTGH